MRCSRCGDSYATNKESTVVPSKVTGLKASNIKSKTIKLTWKKVKGVKYQIQYGTSRKWKKSKKKIVKRTSVWISRLKKQKKYYVRIRCIKKKAGISYYSKWSKKKKM